MKSKFFFSVLSVVVAGTCLTACSSKPTIDFEQCVSVDFNGYENEGNAIVRMDNDYILSLKRALPAAPALPLPALPRPC